MGAGTMRVVVLVCNALAAALVTAALAADNSVFSYNPYNHSEAYTCGVFRCSNDAAVRTLYGEVGHFMQGVQAFGALTAGITVTAVLLHVIQLAGSLTHRVRYLHFAATLCAFMFWVLLAAAYTTPVDIKAGESLVDVVRLQYAVFFGVGAFVLQAVVCVLYPKTGWGTTPALREKPARIIAAVCTAVAVTLVIITMAVRNSVFRGEGSRSNSFGCGVFDCDSNDIQTKDLPDPIGQLFRAAQAFGIITASVGSLALLAHGLLLTAEPEAPVAVTRNLRWLHLAATLSSLLFWLMLVLAYAVAQTPSGKVISDDRRVNFGIFFGVAAFILQAVVCVLYPKPGKMPRLPKVAARVVVTLCTAVALVLLIATMVGPNSVFMSDNVHLTSYGCGVFDCIAGPQTQYLPGTIGKLFRAAQAFSIIAGVIGTFALLAHCLLFTVGLPQLVSRYVRHLHAAAALSLLLFWVTLVLVYNVGQTPDGKVLSDDHTIHFGIFFGVGACAVEIVAYVLYPTTEWYAAPRQQADYVPVDVVYHTKVQVKCDTCSTTQTHGIGLKGVFCQNEQGIECWSYDVRVAEDSPLLQA